jgi:hypothetical protein
MWHNKDNFQILDNYRKCRNSVQSLADFIFDASMELVARADVIEIDVERALDGNERGDGLSDMPLEEVERIRTAVIFWKKFRLPVFNTEDGIKLRLRAKVHETKNVSYERHCALCGNTRPESNWRGHRSSFSCTLCDVHLRIRLHQGFEKTAGLYGTLLGDWIPVSQEDLLYPPHLMMSQTPTKSPTLETEDIGDVKNQ